jgi:hypothetical protein
MDVKDLGVKFSPFASEEGEEGEEGYTISLLRLCGTVLSMCRSSWVGAANRH